jgi:hypothetical protein
MIISASRRTDIPAFYAEWFLQRLRAGGCRVANPMNPRVVTAVSLRPEDVDAIVFWSKNPAPLMPHLDELDSRGFKYAFLFTLNDYPASLEPGVPAVADRLATFRRLAERLGPERVVWRYDPIVLSRTLDARWHAQAFDRLAAALRGHTRRVIVSVVDFYRKSERRLAALERRTLDAFDRNPFALPEFPALIAGLTRAAAENGMAIQSCAEEDALRSLGVKPGKCLDDGWLWSALGIRVPPTKDPGQRPLCGCVASRDIGAPDSCLHDCEYCYATRSAEAALARHGRHDATAPAL